MSYREAQLCMEMIADTGLMSSLDIMELNPALDVRNKTAALAVDLVESLFGKSTLMRQPLSACGAARAADSFGAVRTKVGVR
jgi:arginase